MNWINRLLRSGDRVSASNRVAAIFVVSLIVVSFTGPVFVLGEHRASFGWVIAWAVLWAPLFCVVGNDQVGSSTRQVARRLGAFTITALLTTPVLSIIFLVGRSLR